MTDEQILKAMRELLTEERKHTQEVIETSIQPIREKLDSLEAGQQAIEDSIQPLRESIVKLEDMPRQIKIIAEGHTGLVERLDRIETRLDSIENQLENTVIVKAAR